jgi:hypothetical protein
VPMFEMMVEQYPLIPAWRCGLIYLYEELGRVDDARPHFSLLAEWRFQLPFDANWAVGMSVLAFAAASLGEREACAELHERLLPYEDTVITVGMPVDIIGPMHIPLMTLAAALDRWGDFERHLEAALRWLDDNGGRPWGARVRIEAAAHLVERDAQRARAMLEDACSTSDELDMPRFAATARALLSSS